MSRPDQGEVASEALASFRIASKRYTGDPNAVFGDEADYFAQSRKRFPWTKIVRLYERVERMLPPGDTMEIYGITIFEAPQLGGILKGLSILTSPTQLILLGNRFGLERTFTHLRVRQRLLARDLIEVEIIIPDEYEDCPGFFRVTAGVLQAFPRILGLPNAEVELQLEPRRGLYRVKAPPSRTLFARMRRFFRTLLGADRLVRELTEQQLELNQRLNELKNLNRVLQDALAVRDRFLELISHELQTPMTGVLGALESLTSGPNPQDGTLEDLREASERLRFVIGDILELAKARSLELEPATQDFSLPAVINGLEQRFRGRAEAQGLCFLVEQKSLPLRGRADRNRIERVLVHLLDNAIKFTEAGRVALCARFENDLLIVSVSDTGPGISPVDKERIFEPFFQLDGRATRKKQGSGLGLPLVQVIMQAIGGRLDVDTTVGQGSTFTAHFPLREVESRTSLPNIDSNLPVLIVDDDRLNRRVLARCLERAGLNTVAAADGHEGVKTALSGEFSLVVMDYEMPGMDGIEATRAIKTSKPDLLVLGWSASAGSEVRDRMRAAGVADFLDKPLSASSLRASLQLHGMTLPGPKPGPV